MQSFQPERIIALDLRRQTLGFAVFHKGEDRVLDRGAMSFRGGVNAVRVSLKAKVEALIRTYVPDAIVLQKRKGTKAMLTELKQAAKPNRVDVIVVEKTAVRQFFAGCRNKYEIAAAICDRFVELLCDLPPKRKIWKKEDYRMRIFDAAATGIAYFATKEAAVPPL